MGCDALGTFPGSVEAMIESTGAKKFVSLLLIDDAFLFILTQLIN